MGKTGDTKRQIIEILETKSETLTDISGKLDLAPSTVSQHLKELLDAGQIRLADDKPRKWKYYELDRGPVSSPYARGFQMKSIVIPIGAITLIAVLAIGLYLSGSGGVAVAQQVYIAPGSAVPNGSTVFTLSDSPQFYNISAIFITVTNASVRSTSGTWYRIPLQEHTFNLVQLRNISEILSGVNLTSGSYDAIRLSASNVSAIANGTSEPVFLPTGNLTILGRFNISPNTTNWVNIDFDLESSLHITQNGSIVMLPVLVITHDTGDGIALNSSSIIIARGPQQPMRHESFLCGMNISGSMRGNFTAPQNMTIGFEGGRAVGMGHGPDAFFLRSRGRILIGGDAGAFLMNNILTGNSVNGTWANGSAWANGNEAVEAAGQRQTFGNSQYGANATSQWNASAQSPNGPGGWVSLPPGIIGGNVTGYANCRFGRGSVDCNENDSINATVPPLPRGINPGGLCRGQC